MPNDVDNLIESADEDRRAGRLDEAHRKLAEAVRRSRDSGGELAHALMRHGRIERDRGRKAQALALYEEAAAICRRLDDSRRLAHALRHIGDIHLDADRLDDADACLRGALALHRADASAPPSALANAIRPLAILKSRQGATDDARRLFLEARELYATANIEAGVEECADRLQQLGPP